MTVGILALQGAVQPHAEKLARLGAKVVEVRCPSELRDIQGIILPGGESTTMIHLLKLNQLWNPLKEFVRTKPAWGVCAGTILLAKEVSSPKQESLEAMDIAVVRNAYGRQNESFIAPLEPSDNWRGKSAIEGVFIRAPKISAVSANAKVLLRYKAEPVMVEEGQCLASTFHPELTDSTVIHEYFLEKCRQHG